MQSLPNIKRYLIISFDTPCGEIKIVFDLLKDYIFPFRKIMFFEKKDLIF
jgi:hypothetical protein